MRLLLPAERVFHPVLVVTVGVVLAGVGTTRLLPVGSGSGSLGTVSFVSVKFSNSPSHPQIRSLTRK